MITPLVEMGLVEIAPGLLAKMSRARPLLSGMIGLLAFLALVLAVWRFGALE